MLTSNLWVDVGLVNGAMGTIQAICYRTGGPPDLPIAVMVRFDSYSGPTFPDSTVPITPLLRTWSSSGGQCSRLQLPLKLAWAVTIHKSQGLTLDKVVIDVGKREFSTGLTFVAGSRVRRLQDLLFSPPFPFQPLQPLSAKGEAGGGQETAVAPPLTPTSPNLLLLSFIMQALPHIKHRPHIQHSPASLCKALTLISPNASVSVYIFSTIPSFCSFILDLFFIPPKITLQPPSVQVQLCPEQNVLSPTGEDHPQNQDQVHCPGESPTDEKASVIGGW